MKEKTKNLMFGIEWSLCYYLALDCRKSKKNKKHYSKKVYEINGEPNNWKKINWVKKFNMAGRSVEDWGCFGHWAATDKQVKNVLKVVNMVEPS